MFKLRFPFCLSVSPRSHSGSSSFGTILLVIRYLFLSLSAVFVILRSLVSRPVEDSNDSFDKWIMEEGLRFGAQGDG